MTWFFRLIGGLLVLIVAAAAFVWLNFDSVRYNAVIWLGTPGKAFEAPQPLDYANDAWVALPTRADFADAVIEGQTDNQETASVDAFFVHGTTYGRPYKDSWNQPADDKETHEFTTLTGNGASVFASCCKVYAPRFRQAILGAFRDETGSGEKALDLAYADVERAFDYFLEHHNRGRLFIVSGASQGGKHVFRLLKERISGTDLAKRMVAAYPFIWWMKKDQFAKDAPDIPVCSESAQTGCVVTFNPVGPRVRTGLSPIFDQTGIICVNPLTWRTDGAYAGFDLNIGTRTFKTPNKLIPGMVDAQCDANGRLVVSDIRINIYDGVPMIRQFYMNFFGRENYHSIAGGLFYGNVRRNAKERVDAFMAKQPVE